MQEHPAPRRQKKVDCLMEGTKLTEVVVCFKFSLLVVCFSRRSFRDHGN